MNAKSHTHRGATRANTARGSQAALAPDGNLLAAVHVVSNRIDRAFFSEIAAEHEITLAEWRTILTLAHRPGASASDITGIWGMEKMAVSRAARRLEAAGFVTRRIDGTDKRRYTLALTADGRALYDRIEPAATARYRKIVSALSRDERAALHSALTKLIARIDVLAE